MARDDEFEEKRPDRPPRPEGRRPPPRDDDDDDDLRPSRRRRDDDDEIDYERGDDGVSTLIPYKNPKALVAYYCGVFSLIPFLGALLGPVALIFGILGMKYVRRHPTAKGTGHAIAGIVLGTLTLIGNWSCVAFAIIGLLMGSKR